jgi:VWFA-related protein
VTRGHTGGRLINRAWLGLAFVGALTGPLAAQEQRFEDAVEVTRLLVDVRAVAPDGQSLLGLEASDFEVTIDGAPVKVESVEWTPGAAYVSGATPLEISALPPPEPPGRLVVFFFQTDFHRSRLSGLMRMAPKARAFLETLSEQDFAAVVAYSSHLYVVHDFTADRAKLKAVMTPTGILNEPEVIFPDSERSLMPHFDVDAARKAASPERGLLVTAQALRELPGRKALVLLGWGLGHFSPPATVRMDGAYEPARRVLTEARIPVYALDITDADYHTLEVGLEKVAYDTGGFYAKTHLFPDQAIDKLEGAMEGTYVLVVDAGVLAKGRHTIAVKLKELDGEVFVRPTFEK